MIRMAAVRRFKACSALISVRDCAKKAADGARFCPKSGFFIIVQVAIFASEAVATVSLD